MSSEEKCPLRCWVGAGGYKYGCMCDSWVMWLQMQVCQQVVCCVLAATAWSSKFLNLSHNGSNKQFWATELYGWSFQAPHCLTQTRTDGNFFFFLINLLALLGMMHPILFILIIIIILLGLSYVIWKDLLWSKASKQQVSSNFQIYPGKS